MSAFLEGLFLWDRAFLLARTIIPTDEDADTNQTFILAAVHGSKILQCSITPKVHAMLRHVQWQMKNLPGGVGSKMEDWVECLNQWRDAAVLALLHCTGPPCWCTRKREGNFLQHTPQRACSSGGNRCGEQAKNLSKKANVLLTRQKWQRDEGRFHAIKYIHHTKEERLTWAEVLFHDGKVDL